MPKIFLLSSIAAFFDQLSKFFVLYYFPRLIVTNSGLAFGVFSSDVVTILALLALGVFLLLRCQLSSARLGWPEMLILGGGFGNLLDRLFQGQVLDFIHLGPLPVFNLADAAIVGGIVAIAAEMMVRPKIS